MSTAINKHLFIAGYCHYCDLSSYYKDRNSCVNREEVFVFTTETGDIVNELSMNDDVKAIEFCKDFGISIEEFNAGFSSL